MGWLRASAVAASAALLVLPFRGGAGVANAAPVEPTLAVGYTSAAAVASFLRDHPARILRRLAPLRVVELRPLGDAAAFRRALARRPGIRYVQPTATRRSADEPALFPSADGLAYEWQYDATHENAVPDAVLRAASAVKIAIVDTGADVTAPDIAAKSPLTWSVVGDSSDVQDANGHGTFVASIAAGSVTNGDGIAGFGGDAQLVVVQASGADGTFTDLDEANGIVWAVDHGARVINLSLGGSDTSQTEQNAIAYASSHGVLVVAAAGNDYQHGDPVEYPAALLQPAGSNGVGGVGLSVGATTQSGARAFFSNSGSYLSLAAPGVDVLGDVSSTSSPSEYPRLALPGSTAGLYGVGSGTSFAAPQVAGAAALVWAANPLLTAAQVAQILKDTASNGGSWNPDTGWGVLDVAAAVAKADGGSFAPASVRLTGRRLGRRVQLAWSGQGAASFRLSVSQDGGPVRTLAAGTTTGAAYTLVPGHAYLFTVAALDGSGTTVATSGAYRVTLPPVARLTTRLAPRRR